MLHRVHKHVTGEDIPTLLCGDFNFIAQDEVRFDAATGDEHAGDYTLAKLLEDLFPELVELHQGEYTRRQTSEGRFTTLSRLDRIYFKVDPLDILDLMPHTVITHKLCDPNFPSD